MTRRGMSLIELMIVLLLLEVLVLQLPGILRHARRAEARADVTLDALARRERLARTLRADLDRAVRVDASPAGLQIDMHDARVTWVPAAAGLVRHGPAGDTAFPGARLLERTAVRGALVTCALDAGGAPVLLTRLLGAVTR